MGAAATDRTAEAEALAREAVASLQEPFDGRHHLIGVGLRQLGDIREKEGRLHIQVRLGRFLVEHGRPAEGLPPLPVILP